MAKVHGGEVSRLQGEGDSAVALFGSAAPAVAAALDVNRWMAASVANRMTAASEWAALGGAP